MDPFWIAHATFVALCLPAGWVMCRRAGIAPTPLLALAIPLFGPALLAGLLLRHPWPALPPRPPKPVKGRRRPIGDGA